MWCLLLGDHQPYTATTKDFRFKKRDLRGWCTNCQNLREQQNVYHPRDCTGNVHWGRRADCRVRVALEPGRAKRQQSKWAVTCTPATWAAMVEVTHVGI